MSSGLFYDLGSSFLAPRRAREDEAREVVGKTRGLAEVWERLNSRGLVSDDLFQSDRRMFSSNPLTQNGWYPRDPTLLCERHPDSVEAAITIASDAAGVARAESITTEWYGLFEGRGPEAKRLLGIVWRVLPSGSERWRLFPYFFDDLYRFGTAAERALVSLYNPSRVVANWTMCPTVVYRGDDPALNPGGAVYGDLGTTVNEVAERYRRAVEDLTRGLDSQGGIAAPGRGAAPQVDSLEASIRSAIFVEAASRSARVTMAMGNIRFRSRPLRVGSAISEVPNHYVALLDLYATGYGLSGVLPVGNDGDWVVLCARAADSSKMPAGSTTRRRR